MPHSNATAAAWSESRIEALSEHFRLGLTAAQSAVLLETTKNAVISKRRRLGLVFAPRTLCGAIAGAPEISRPPGGPRRYVFRTTPPQFSTEPLPQMDLPLPADAAPAALTALRCNQCAWPLGAAEDVADWRTRFCGAPVARGRFCVSHAAVAYICRAAANG